MTSRTANIPTRNLPLIAFDDRSLLHALDDNTSEDGFTDAGTVAEVLDVERRAVASRFAWLVRFGMVEREVDTFTSAKARAAHPKSKPSRYRLTRAGRSIITATLTTAQEAVLAKMVNGKGVAALGSLMAVETDPQSARMMRREFTYRDAKRRAPQGSEPR